MRGSCPCPSEANRRYGGNTACVAVQAGQDDPIILDLGTGLRALGVAHGADRDYRGAALITHMHWDHVQGLPFFPPIHRPGSSLDIYGPGQEDGPLGEVFSGLMRPPYFPVQYSDLEAAITFHDVASDTFTVGEAKVTARPVPHVGPTVGYRIDWDGRSVGYVSDHQQPRTGHQVADSVLELLDGVDLLIHDAQYTPAELSERSDWGHCTVDYAVWVAKEAGVKALALFHHDPGHADEEIDRMLEWGRCLGGNAGVEVLAAAEGESLVV
ncbi:MAG TPA: MBL fold metallo-hydrolase [Acidimicrobiales bacterium]|nr:MBL fold metallo-hydrolase [Acidimicrobiales bacterium]